MSLPTMLTSGRSEIGDNWTDKTIEGKTYKNAPVTLKFPLSFISGENIAVTQDVELTAQLRLKFEKSEDILSCEKSERRLDDSIDKQKTVKTALLVLATIVTVAAAGFALACLETFGSCQICCDHWVLALVIAACVDSVLLPLIGMFSSKENELKGQKQALCAEKRVGGLHEKLSATDGMWYQVGGGYGAGRRAVRLVERHIS